MHGRRWILALVLVIAGGVLTGCVPPTGTQATRDNPTLVCIRNHESANLPNPWAAYNPSGPYYGAYQYTAQTWMSAANATGRPELANLVPMEPYVSGWDQDSVTLAYHNLVGDGPWGSRC